jgi:hypothetical protein
MVIGVRLLILVTQQHGDSPQVLLILIVYEIWIGEAAKLAKPPVETHLLHTKYMLVRTCRMGNLPIRLHVRN